jgi:hypothetical protein
LERGRVARKNPPPYVGGQYGGTVGHWSRPWRRGGKSAAGADYKAIRRGWCLGEDSFRQELLAQVTERRGAEHYGTERLETDVTKAERIIREELQQRRWQESDLAKRAKGDVGKVADRGSVAGGNAGDGAVDCGTARMGTLGYVNNRLYRWCKGTLA